jgi:hypothetical protein
MNFFKVLFLTLTLLVVNIQAQKLSAKWSDRMILDDKVDGFFGEIAGGNEKYIYARFNNGGVGAKIIGFDKKTLTKQFKAEISGFDSNKKDEKKYKNLNIYQTVVYEDVIYVFYKSYDKKETKILVRSYTPELKELNELTVVTTQKDKIARENKEAFPFIRINAKAGKVFIGVEKETKPGDNIKLEYKVLNKDFSFSTSDRVTLPLEYKAGRRGRGVDGMSSRYDLGDDGNVHIRSTIYPTRKEVKDVKRKSKRSDKTENLNKLSYEVLSTINLKSGKFKSVNIKVGGKKLFSVNRMVTKKGGAKIFGYYSDFSKDKNGYEAHGLYYAKLNKDYEIENLKFSAFSKELIRDMFRNDKDDLDGGRKGGCCLIGKKGSTHAADETMNSDYEIEQYREGKNGDVYLFASIMNNYSVESCSTDANGNTTCTTSYYCQKKNITVFKLDEKGNIVWGRNQDRNRTYSGWFVYDVNVIKADDGFYVTYGDFSNYQRTKAWWKVWKTIDRTNPLEYIHIDEDAGKISELILKTNSANATKEEAKYISPLAIQSFDDVFYIGYSELHSKKGLMLLFCAGGCLIGGHKWSFKTGYGYFGVLEPTTK